jgi:hypothetical protein
MRPWSPPASAGVNFDGACGDANGLVTDPAATASTKELDEFYRVAFRASQRRGRHGAAARARRLPPSSTRPRATRSLM